MYCIYNKESMQELHSVRNGKSGLRYNEDHEEFRPFFDTQLTTINDIMSGLWMIMETQRDSACPLSLHDHS